MHSLEIKFQQLVLLPIRVPVKHPPHPGNFCSRGMFVSQDHGEPPGRHWGKLRSPRGLAVASGHSSLFEPEKILGILSTRVLAENRRNKGAHLLGGPTAGLWDQSQRHISMFRWEGSREERSLELDTVPGAKIFGDVTGWS